MFRARQAIASPNDILGFWFDEAGPKKWYAQSDAFDAQVRRKFEETAITLAVDGADWEDTPERHLALIIALDQFPRNMYRGTSAAFAWDGKASASAKRAVDKGWDVKTDQTRRAFIYMPFMHAEDLAVQNECVRLVDSRLNDASTLHHAKEHRKVIERFGRFPHRNDILGRASTAEEIHFLDKGGYSP